MPKLFTVFLESYLVSAFEDEDSAREAFLSWLREELEGGTLKDELTVEVRDE